jgi:hypothetical protein
MSGLLAIDLKVTCGTRLQTNPLRTSVGEVDLSEDEEEEFLSADGPTPREAGSQIGADDS